MQKTTNGHAVLSASGAARWLACTPSARLEENLPDNKSTAADEGTLAHFLGESLIKWELHDSGHPNRLQFEDFQLRNDIETDPLYTPAMRAYCEDYAAFVLERYNDALSHTKDAVLDLEVKLDFSKYVPDGYGTGDVCIIADGTLEIIDLKFGKGVEVSAVDNPQMKLYALGALEKYDWLYTIDRVKMTIYQPRIDNFSTWVVTVKELRQWAETELREKADLAFKGQGDFVPGKHCHFCKVLATCRANAAFQMDIARTDFLEPVLLDTADISDILLRASMFKNWIKAVETYALHAAVTDGKKFPGLKLVEGRANRIYKDAETMASLLNLAGYDNKDIFELIGITKLEKLVGKKPLDKLVGQYIVKPSGKPTLVPQEDKRPEISGVDSALADFENDIDE